MTSYVQYTVQVSWQLPEAPQIVSGAAWTGSENYNMQLGGSST